MMDKHQTGGWNHFGYFKREVIMNLDGVPTIWDDLWHEFKYGVENREDWLYDFFTYLFKRDVVFACHDELSSIALSCVSVYDTIQSIVEDVDYVGWQREGGV